MWLIWCILFPLTWCHFQPHLLICDPTYWCTATNKWTGSKFSMYYFCTQLCGFVWLADFTECSGRICSLNTSCTALKFWLWTSVRFSLGLVLYSVKKVQYINFSIENTNQISNALIVQKSITLTTLPVCFTVKYTFFQLPSSVKSWKVWLQDYKTTFSCRLKKYDIKFNLKW